MRRILPGAIAPMILVLARGSVVNVLPIIAEPASCQLVISQMMSSALMIDLLPGSKLQYHSLKREAPK